MNKGLNKIIFVISIVVLCILICLEKIFTINIDMQVYLITIMVSIVSLGNIVVNILRERKEQRK